MGARRTVMMSLVYALAVIVIVWVTIFGSFALSQKIEKRKEKKLQQEKDAREKMLRIMPQLGIQQFREVVHTLGWITKSKKENDWFWTWNLPTAEYGPLDLIGATFGSILSDWQRYSPSPTLANLAQRVVEQYDDNGQESFIKGMASTNPDEEERMRIIVDNLKRVRTSELDAAERKKIAEAGILASQRFIQR
jgi:hypothetical protein